jgi:uncharacterized protein YlxW (UPF0749 family)
MIILEFFLAHYEILTLPTLGVVFIFFSLIIINTLLPLTIKDKTGRAQMRQKSEDELQRLERLVLRAMQDRESEAADALGKRLRSLALQIASYRTDVTLSQLEEQSADPASLLAQIIQDEQLVRLLTRGPNGSAQYSAREIEVVLTTLEGWVA